MPKHMTSYVPHEDEDYMNRRQLDFFRHRLLAWRIDLQQENQRCSSVLNNDNGRQADVLDQVVENTQRNLAMLGGQRTRHTIEQVDAALQRICDGSYGYCLRTGEEIGVRRLLAWPVATLSVAAQEVMERNATSDSRMAI